jgi:hypothetical protein
MKLQFLSLVLVMGFFMQATPLKRITKIAEVLNYAKKVKVQGCKSVWWVTDLDNTLVNMSQAYSLVEGQSTGAAFNEIKKEVTAVIGLTNTSREFVQQVYKGTNHKNIEFFIPEKTYNDRVQIDGPCDSILYNGIIFTRTFKGTALVSFLNCFPYFKLDVPDAIIFSDDKEKNVKSVVQAMEKYFPAISIVGLHYSSPIDE